MNGDNLGQNQNFNQGSPFPSPSFSESNQQTPAGPFGQKEEPFAPPPSNIFIRTSESDLEKVQQEGGNVSFAPPTQPERPQEEVSFAPPQGFAPPSQPQIYTSQPETGPAISPEIPASEISGLPVTPPPKKKFLPFIIIGVLIIAGAALGYFILWPKIFGSKKVVEVKTTTTTTVTTTTTTTTLPPSPYVSLGAPYAKSFVNIEVKGNPALTAIRKVALEETAPAGTFKVLIPKVKGIALTDEEVILSLIPKLPENLKPFVLGDKKFLVYAYYGQINPSLGLIIEIGPGNKEAVKPIFLNWEKKLQILKDLANFYLVKIPTQVGKAFKEVSNLGAEIRTFDYKGEEVDLTYAFFDKYLMISSSLESVNSALERLQRPLEPIYPF